MPAAEAICATAKPAGSSARSCWPQLAARIAVRLCAAVLRAGISTPTAACWPCIRRGRTARDDRALGDRRSGRACRCRRGRSCRMSNAFTIGSRSRSCAAALAVPLLPEHGHQAAAANPRGRNDRGRRRSKRIATRASTRFRCCRSLPATIRYFEQLLAPDARDVSAAGREHLRCPVCG